MKLKLRSSARFLASIFDGVGTSVRKDGLATYVDLDYGDFADLSTFSPTAKKVAIQDIASGEWNTAKLSTLMTGSAAVYVLQQITGASATIADDTTIAVVNRTGPALTALTVPSVSARQGRSLSIVDYSSSVTAHDISITVQGGSDRIMRQTTWHLYSTASSLGGLTLRPITELNAWIIAP